ncbi:hypothetical protein T265_01422 [Opisthorchis viverrini]|uniref:Reverse transcriptase domain-containing protein n=1 Tax=Opisthorchis viverrini TaxID=6198 RepID=A0A075A2R7_OPIVI|nr:hypothetical protein T265_01422 [Opisthorchis viverrini]KER32547.1 hypothetical protein T265_01422 [Opisthorchis viverrini]
MRQTLDGFQNPGVQIVAGGSPADLEYADDIALIFEDHSEAQTLLNKLTAIIPSFGMGLAPSTCKVLLQNVPSANISLTIQGELLEIVGNFTYLGSCISSDGIVSDEVSARISKARITFANLRHLWRQKGISLDLKGRVYQATSPKLHGLRPLLLWRDIRSGVPNNATRWITALHRLLDLLCSTEERINAHLSTIKSRRKPTPQSFQWHKEPGEELMREARKPGSNISLIRGGAHSINQSTKSIGRRRDTNRYNG